MVGMFLMVVGHSTRLSVVAERFQHSKETVSRLIKVIVRGIHSLSPTYIRRRNVDVQPEIQRCRKWYPFFKNCIGAINGTHVSATVPSSVRGAYRDRNNEITQNVLAACSHDMMFTHVVTGWEGSAHDSRILSDAATLQTFPAPYGEQYYVIDAGYPNIPGYMAPYKGQRYHRSDFNDDTPPTTEKELFNQRHASVRNVIERCFGVLKRRFAILLSMPNYGPVCQGQITLACFVLHNFIRLNNYHDRLFAEYGNAWQCYDEFRNPPHLIGDQVDVNMRSREMDALRNRIADAIWQAETR
ncbi:protein ALP1-like [Punica granatum]|uniref:Protein ALP1-like n=1 Tax=Punica granatum TaxID=22663 RepID=A0A6P8CTH8_PUNGR|nr:protein ALP1-like [Punica granatum]